MASRFHNQPYDVQQALTEFSTEFDKALALGEVEQWAVTLGYQITSEALRVTLPIPLGTAGYKLRKGDDQLRKLFERSMSFTTKEWYDGVEEEERVITDSATFTGWYNAPAEMALEAQRHPNVLIADMLTDTTRYLDFYRDVKPGGVTALSKTLFDDAHPFNVLKTAVGTFDNDWDDGDTVQGDTVPTEINKVLIAQLRKHFRSIKGPNGRPMGLRLSGLIIPPKWEENALDVTTLGTAVTVVQNAAGTENVAAVTQDNRYRGLQVQVADELVGDLPSGNSGDEDTIYAVASRGAGLAPPPWVVQEGRMKEIVYDESDAKYKDEGKVGVKRIQEWAAEPCLPHAIVRIDLSS